MKNQINPILSKPSNYFNSLIDTLKLIKQKEFLKKILIELYNLFLLINYEDFRKYRN